MKTLSTLDKVDPLHIVMVSWSAKLNMLFGFGFSPSLQRLSYAVHRKGFSFRAFLNASIALVFRSVFKAIFARSNKANDACSPNSDTTSSKQLLCVQFCRSALSASEYLKERCIFS